MSFTLQEQIGNCFIKCGGSLTKIRAAALRKKSYLLILHMNNLNTMDTLFLQLSHLIHTL